MSRKNRVMKRLLRGVEVGEGINLTPLMDMIFNLIFFFILATEVRQSHAFLEVRLPHVTQTARMESAGKTLVITVTKDNRVFLEKREISPESLEAELKKIPPAQVSRIAIKGDAQAYHETIVKVLDACVKAGHTGVSVEVKSEKY